MAYLALLTSKDIQFLITYGQNKVVNPHNGKTINKMLTFWIDTELKHLHFLTDILKSPHTFLFAYKSDKETIYLLLDYEVKY